MVEFAYDKAKNATISHTLFKFNCGYYSKVLFKKDVNFYSKSCSINKLIEKLRELIEICCQNLFYA